MDLYDQMRDDLNHISRNLLLKQIILNQAAILACELEKEHGDEVKELCRRAFDTSRLSLKEDTDG